MEKKLSKIFFNNQKQHNLSNLNYDCESQIYVLHNFQKLKICSLNTNGAKKNLNYIQYLIKNYDFIFLCETWLLDSEIFYLKS